MSDAPLTLKEQVNEVEEFLQKPKIVFGISLKSKKVARDWTLVQENLSKTIRSIINNTDPHFHIIIAGHEKPKIKEMKEPRVTWLSVEFPPPKSTNQFSRDKCRKRMVIGAYLRKTGFSGYFMPLDADDWIHYRFVEYIRSFPVTDAFIINKGLMINVVTKEAWVRDHFYKGCGSSAVFYFSNDHFPTTSKREDVKMTPYKWTLIHGKVQHYLDQENKRYVMVDDPLVTWVLAHGENNSMIKKKKDNRVSAKSYKKYNAVEGKLEAWFYDYFRIDAKI